MIEGSWDGPMGQSGTLRGVEKRRFPPDYVPSQDGAPQESGPAENTSREGTPRGHSALAAAGAQEEVSEAVVIGAARPVPGGPVASETEGESDQPPGRRIVRRPVASAKQAVPVVVNGDVPLPALEAEAFLEPSWVAGVAEGPTVEEKKKKRGRRVWREVIETVLLALLVFLGVRFALQNYIVDGASMYPTLEGGQHILVNKLAYAEINLDRLTDFIPFVDMDEGETWSPFGSPGRGDIVVFASLTGGNDLIKRVIGLPGERLSIVDGRVYINGWLLEESYIVEPWAGTHEEVLIPDRHYFVMGDNRNGSHDSRSPLIGFVSQDSIVGKGLLRYWPLSEFGLAPNGGANLPSGP